MTQLHSEYQEIQPLESLGSELNAAVIGASGSIGGALADQLDRCHSVANVLRLSRSTPRAEKSDKSCFHLDLDDEDSIAEAASAVKNSVGKLHLVIVASGILHDGDALQPEKTWRALTASAMHTSFQVNTIGPGLVAKHFLPLLAENRKTVFAALSARVGSIEDNRLGGWHAYRASKSALNMLIKTLSIELARRNPKAICVGLHPGTVDTALSKPFQSGIPQVKRFTPAESAGYLLNVLNCLTPQESGNIYAWDGTRIPF